MIRTIELSAAFPPNPDRPPFYVDFQYQLVDGHWWRFTRSKRDGISLIP